MPGPEISPCLLGQKGYEIPSLATGSEQRCRAISDAPGGHAAAHPPPDSWARPKARGTTPRRAAVALIRFYQLAVSPLLGPHCRFVPSCSAYTAESISRHGIVRGGWEGLRRLLRCHPLHPGGYDPVG